MLLGALGGQAGMPVFGSKPFAPRLAAFWADVVEVRMIVLQLSLDARHGFSPSGGA